MLRVVTGAGLATAVAWGSWRYGATETWALYALFLLLLAPALAAAWALPAERVRDARFLPFLAVGMFLLAQTVLRPTLEGRGYVLASVGWLALFSSVALAAEKRGAARILVVFLVLAGGLEAAYGLVQSAGGNGSDGARALATGTLINRNHFAGLLNMALPLALGALYANYARRRARGSPRSETYAWSWLFILSCSFMGLAILQSLSRGGALTLVGTLVFMGLALTLGRRRRGATDPGTALSGLAAGILLLTVLALGLVVGLYALGERFGDLADASPVEGRAAIYLDTLRLIRDHPASGVGPGMFRWRFRPYQTVQVESRFDHTHNDYLQTAAEWGLPAALVLWGFIAWRFYRAMSIFLRSRDPWRQGTALGCCGAIFSMLLHSLVDFNLQIPVNLAIFCTILGLAWSLETSSRDPADPAARSSAG